MPNYQIGADTKGDVTAKVFLFLLMTRHRAIITSTEMHPH